MVNLKIDYKVKECLFFRKLDSLTLTLVGSLLYVLSSIPVFNKQSMFNTKKVCDYGL